MRRAVANFWIDFTILATGLVTFVTGLVLFFSFHIGNGQRAMEAIGISRMVWLNTHRLCALVVLAGIVAHVALHWRAFLSRLWRSNALTAGRRRSLADPLLYLAFSVMTLTGIVAWLVIEGSTPLRGPIVVAQLSPVRHPWIDVHNISGLLALVLTTVHVIRRWRVLVRLGVAATSDGPPWSVRIAFWGQATLFVLRRLVRESVTLYERMVGLRNSERDTPRPPKRQDRPDR